MGSGTFTLVVGGSRSGKSEHAEQILLSRNESVTYLATARPDDDEMRERIRKHRDQRPEDWKTVEPDYDLRSIGNQLADKTKSVLLDGFGLLVADWLENGRKPEEILAIVDKFIGTIPGDRDWVVVSSLVNRGIIPRDSESRRFRDLMGRINQKMADSADRVDEVVVGVARTIKADNEP